MAKKILVTAFEPFGGKSENPTLRVLAALKAPPGARLFKARLPVDGRVVGKKIERLLKIKVTQNLFIVELSCVSHYHRCCSRTPRVANGPAVSRATPIRRPALCRGKKPFLLLFRYS